MPQILTGGALLITKLCCVMCNDATKIELTRSLSVVPVNYSTFVISLLNTSFFSSAHIWITVSTVGDRCD